ncbi:MAG: DNA repair protein RecN [Betaproteobacteria bacterium]|nr:DNA repair protein RecN [Betaproteobacteria bacterium]
MLGSISIRDFVIVDRLDLDFGSGFNVLTGETGAGKSILLDALGLLLGERASPGLIRPGAERAELAATFEFDPAGPLASWLDDNDCADEPGLLLLRRVVDTSGRSRAAINGRPATLAQLREATEQLVNVHGQNAHLMLTRPEVQREFLDRYAAADGLAQAVAAAFRDWHGADAALRNWQASAAAWTARLLELRHDIAELEPLAGDRESLAELEAEHQRLAHAQGLIDASQAALDAISESETNASDLVAAAQIRIDDATAIDPRLGDTASALHAASAHIGEAASQLRRYLDRVEIDPDRLSEVETQLAEVQRLARKHRRRSEELPELLAALRTELEGMGGDGDAESVLRNRVDTAHREYAQHAGALRSARLEAGERLQTGVTACMQRLSLAGGRFVVALLDEVEPTAHGSERVDFLVAANAGLPPGPLARVASGGELSRIGLALSTVSAAALAAGTLVFDEVDAGIGGGVAEVVGRLLQELGTQRQVLCVTHLAQVAACARQQFRVAKAVREGVTTSHVEALSADQRVDELARMIGGMQITDTTRAHARELLATLAPGSHLQAPAGS